MAEIFVTIEIQTLIELNNTIYTRVSGVLESLVNICKQEFG